MSALDVDLIVWAEGCPSGHTILVQRTHHRARARVELTGIGRYLGDLGVIHQWAIADAGLPTLDDLTNGSDAAGLWLALGPIALRWRGGTTDHRR